MTDTQRIPALLVLLQQAEQTRDAALGALRRSGDAARRPQAQLEQLLQYRSD